MATAGVAPPVRADVLPLFVDVPGTYTPNAPFSFELRAPGLDGFTSFSLDLIVQTDSPDSVMLLGVVADRPGDAAYPFGAAGSFTTSQSAVGGSSQFTVHVAGGGAAVGTTAGGNDLLATVTVTPGPDLNEPVTFAIDPTTLRFNTLTEGGSGFQAPDPVTVFPDATPPPATPVPAPAGVVLLGLGGVVLAARRRFAARA